MTTQPMCECGCDRPKAVVDKIHSNMRDPVLVALTSRVMDLSDFVDGCNGTYYINWSAIGDQND